MTKVVYVSKVEVVGPDDTVVWLSDGSKLMGITHVSCYQGVEDFGRYTIEGFMLNTKGDTND
jgi:hypothetical protein